MFQADSIIALPQRPPDAASIAPMTEGPVTLGVAEMDAGLDGGLKPDGLHETYAATANDAAAGLTFLLLLAERKRRQSASGHLLWAREAGAPGLPYGPGLVEMGIDPAAITLLALPDALSVLRAGLDGLRHGGATVLIELHGRQRLYDLTASRRLALAAGTSGAMALVLRSGAPPTPSVAHTRWRITPAPSAALEANAPGAPAFALTLLRQRGGREGLSITLEWDRDQAIFRRPDFPSIAGVADLAIPLRSPLFGAVFALAAGRARGGGRPRSG